MENPETAWAASIEIDGRQQYLFESDKLQEMLGASRLMDQSVDIATEICNGFGVHLFNPVSGEIRMWSEDRTKVLNAAWKLRRWLEAHGIGHTAVCIDVPKDYFVAPGVLKAGEELDADQKPSAPSLSWVHKKLSSEVSRLKRAKCGTDARPACSLFAPCQIHGTEPANHWRADSSDTVPKWYSAEERRWLVSYRAKAKLREWQGEKDTFIREFLQPVSRDTEPKLFADLKKTYDTLDFEDQYIAFVCADADHMGDLLGRINWNLPECVKEGSLPWQRNHRFADELAKAHKDAFRDALRDVLEPWLAQLRKNPEKAKTAKLPVLPQLLGGDDLWMVCARHVALTLASRFSEEFRSRVTPVVQAAAPDAQQDLTMSVGIAFAKAGYPAHAMREAAESLLKSAKGLRRGQLWGRGAESEGCLDWHWIESSLIESVADARASGASYQDPPERGRDAAPGRQPEVMLLTTRPWAVGVYKHFTDAAQEFEKISRRKREQLDDILRRGRPLSVLAWHTWWDGLTQGERERLGKAQDAIAKAGVKLPPAGPAWKNGAPFEPWAFLSRDGERSVYWTPWLDLMGLLDLKRGIREGVPEDAQS